MDESPIDNLDILRKQIEKVKEEEDIELKSELLEKLLMVRGIFLRLILMYPRNCFSLIGNR